MNVAIVGSRNWTDVDLIFQVMEDVAMYITTDLTIVSGHAAGADSIGEMWADEHGVPLIIHRPEWGKYGRSAGYKRNVLIVNDADLVLAFQVGRSRGTQHTIDIAQKQGVPCIVWTQ